MTTQKMADREFLVEHELTRSEAERTRLQAQNERLLRAAQVQLKIETALRIDLERARAAQADAQRSIQMSLAEVQAMRQIWTHAQTQLELERRQRFALQTEVKLLRRDNEQIGSEVAAIRADRDDARRHLETMATSSSWRITRPLRLGVRIIRGIRRRVG